MRLDSPWWTLDGPAHQAYYAVRGGARIDASLEALTPSEARGWLERWLLEPTARRKLLEIHRCLFGGLSSSQWAAEDVAQLLRHALGIAIERRDLLILDLRRAGGAAPDIENPEIGPSSSKPPPPPGRGTFVEIELVDERGARFASRLRFKGPSGSPEQPRFDGFVRIEELESGVCDIEFPQIDGREWGPHPEGAGSGKRTGFDHVVVWGECVSSISGRSGFASWRTVYDDPKNADLRALRPNPNALVQGDVVFVPDPEPRVEEAPTGRRATYRTLAVPTRLRVRFEGRSVNDYELHVAGTVLRGQVGPGAMIDEVIPSNATTAELVMRPTSMPEQVDRWTIVLGALHPVAELVGCQARLSNIGFDCPVDGAEGEETTRAIAAYQKWRGVGDGAGTLDDATRDDLQSFHDG